MTDFCQTCGRQKGLHFSVLPACTCTTAAPFYYPIQPKREWVGLTDDEVFELADTNLYDGGKNYGVLAFAKSIEAKLKERNE
jgi:hypothetical protein